MQDGDRFPESAGWRLMSQLWDGDSLDHNVYNTAGPEGSTVVIV
jgi:hypothetical protein